MLRRNLLRGIACGVPAVLAACSTSTSGGTTTLTIDTAKVSTDGSAIITALTSTLAIPSVAVLLGANVPVAAAALAAAQGAINQFDIMTGGSVSLSYNVTNAIALVNSLINDARTVLSLLQPILPALKAPDAVTVTNYVNAITALIPIVQLAIALASPAPAAAKPLMSEAQALYIATH
jgi:hypothetical protein